MQPAAPRIRHRLGAGCLLAISLASVHSQDPIRIGLRARNGGADRLTSLRYVGGFETKTLLLETLVRRGADGRIAPSLASRWSIENDGRSFRFEIRPDARFHDGTPVTADAVRTHLLRWVGLPEHDWLRANREIRGVEVLSPREFRIDLIEPYALLEDLVAINPCAVVGPAARDWEGEFTRPIGTGPFRFVEAFDSGRRWRLAKIDEAEKQLDVSFYPRGRDATPIDDLLASKIDVFVGGWDEDLPADRIDALRDDDRFAVQTAPGSSVVYLSFALDDAVHGRGPVHDDAPVAAEDAKAKGSTPVRDVPTADPRVRRRIAAAIDRDALIRELEDGRAEPCATWAAPSVGFWPAGPAALRLRKGTSPERGADLDAAEPGGSIELRIAGGAGDRRAARVARAVAAQLERAGFRVELLLPSPSPAETPTELVDASGTVAPLTTESGEVRAAARRAEREITARADIHVEITYGMPYCPHESLVARFGKRRDSSALPRGCTPELQDLVELAAHTPDETERIPIYTRIQSLMDREALIVPLYVPNRIALRSKRIDGIRLLPEVYSVDLVDLRRVDQ